MHLSQSGPGLTPHDLKQDGGGLGQNEGKREEREKEEGCRGEGRGGEKEEKRGDLIEGPALRSAPPSPLLP